MGIKGLKISMIVSISFDTEGMPRLNPQQREQAIGRLHAGQPARVIANDFNYNVRTIERQRVRYNATNSTNDRPRCGRPQVTTARQSVSKLILTIIEIFKPFIPIPKHENHEHLTIQNFYRKVCRPKGGRF
jgi:hypothetical protein